MCRNTFPDASGKIRYVVVSTMVVITMAYRATVRYLTVCQYTSTRETLGFSGTVSPTSNLRKFESILESSTGVQGFQQSGPRVAKPLTSDSQLPMEAHRRLPNGPAGSTRPFWRSSHSRRFGHSHRNPSKRFYNVGARECWCERMPRLTPITR